MKLSPGQMSYSPDLSSSGQCLDMVPLPSKDLIGIDSLAKHHLPQLPILGQDVVIYVGDPRKNLKEWLKCLARNTPALAQLVSPRLSIHAHPRVKSPE